MSEPKRLDVLQKALCEAVFVTWQNDGLDMTGGLLEADAATAKNRIVDFVECLPKAYRNAVLKQRLDAGLKLPGGYSTRWP